MKLSCTFPFFPRSLFFRRFFERQELKAAARANQVPSSMLCLRDSMKLFTLSGAFPDPIAGKWLKQIQIPG